MPTECASAVLGAYRPAAFIGFVLGTMYQYVLLKLVVEVGFRDVAGIPQVSFNRRALLGAAFSFAMA